MLKPSAVSSRPSGFKARSWCSCARYGEVRSCNSADLPLQLWLHLNIILLRSGRWANQEAPRARCQHSQTCICIGAGCDNRMWDFQMAGLINRVEYKGKKNVLSMAKCHGLYMFFIFKRLRLESGFEGTRWRSWMRHRAASRKVAGSIARWCPWNFSVTAFQPHYGHGVDSDSNRNEYQGISWGVKRPVRRPDNLTVFLGRMS
jgi:hypothetical protein